jgi:hypothetical protein
MNIALPADCVIDCSRCAANGRLDRYAHVHGGVCFLCQGTKRRPNAKGRKVLALRELEAKIAAFKAKRQHVLVIAAVAAMEVEAAGMRAALAA